MSMNAPQGVIPQWTAEDRLLKARRLAGLTQPELAHLLGISEKTVKRYEGGEPTKRGIVLAWAMVCGVNARWLETGEYTGPGNNPDQETSMARCIRGPWVLDATAVRDDKADETARAS